MNFNEDIRGIRLDEKQVASNRSIFKEARESLTTARSDRNASIQFTAISDGRSNLNSKFLNTVKIRARLDTSKLLKVLADLSSLESLADPDRMAKTW